MALADQAEFLDPPPAEIPNQSAPSVAQQREIIAKSIDYVKATLERLPNLFANRDTIRFEDIPPGLHDPSTDTIVPYQPLHPVSRASGNGALSGWPGTHSEATGATGRLKSRGNRHDDFSANSDRFFLWCMEICRRAI